jgi:hypothetical protein
MNPILPAVTLAVIAFTLAWFLAQSGRAGYVGGACQVCRREAQLNPVTFRYNIGMLVARRYATLQGRLCKTCIHRTYWKYAAINLTVGWLGYISLIVAPSFLAMNTYFYLRSALLAPAAAVAGQNGFLEGPPPIA